MPSKSSEKKPLEDSEKEPKKKRDPRGRKTNEEIIRPFREQIAELKEHMEKLKIENIERDLSYFERFLNIVRGKVDAKYRLRLLLEPDNVRTTTRLTRGERDFVTLSDFVADKFPEEGFGGLKDFATILCYTNISLEGLGRAEAIQYEGAISESKLLSKLNIFKTEEAKTVKGKV